MPRKWPIVFFSVPASRNCDLVVAVSENIHSIMEHWKYIERHILPVCESFDVSRMEDARELRQFCVVKVTALHSEQELRKKEVHTAVHRALATHPSEPDRDHSQRVDAVDERNQQQSGRRLSRAAHQKPSLLSSELSAEDASLQQVFQRYFDLADEYAFYEVACSLWQSSYHKGKLYFSTNYMCFAAPDFKFVLPFIDVARLHVKRTGLLKHGSIEVYGANGSSYDISLLGEFHEQTELLIRQLWVLNVHHLLETMHREEALEKNRRRGLAASNRILRPEERLTQMYTRDLLMEKISNDRYCDRFLLPLGEKIELQGTCSFSPHPRSANTSCSAPPGLSMHRVPGQLFVSKNFLCLHSCDVVESQMAVPFSADVCFARPPEPQTDPDGLKQFELQLVTDHGMLSLLVSKTTLDHLEERLGPFVPSTENSEDSSSSSSSLSSASSSSSSSSASSSSSSSSASSSSSSSSATSSLGETSLSSAASSNTLLSPPSPSTPVVDSPMKGNAGNRQLDSRLSRSSTSLDAALSETQHCEYAPRTPRGERRGKTSAKGTFPRSKSCEQLNKLLEEHGESDSFYRKLNPLWKTYFPDPADATRITSVCVKSSFVEKLILDTEPLPKHLRGSLWLLWSGSMYESASRGGEEYYWSILNAFDDQTTTATQQIDRDVLRSFPSHPFFQTEEGTSLLKRILVAYSWHNPQIGYCQSMNIVAAVFLLFIEEEECFFLLSSLCERLMPRCYVPTMLGALIDQEVLNGLVEKHFPAVNEVLTKLHLPVPAICLPWFLCLFIGHLPLECTIRLLDWFFFEGRTVLFKVALAIFQIKSKILQHCEESHEVIECLRDLSDFDTQELLRIASTQFQFLNHDFIEEHSNNCMVAVMRRKKEERESFARKQREVASRFDLVAEQSEGVRLKVTTTATSTTTAASSTEHSQATGSGAPSESARPNSRRGSTMEFSEVRGWLTSSAVRVNPRRKAMRARGALRKLARRPQE